MPHVVLRGGVWRFRRRTPKRFLLPGATAMWEKSLLARTLSDAAVRAQALAEAFDEAFMGLEEMLVRNNGPVTAELVDSVVSEVLDERLRGVLAAHASGGVRTVEEAEARLAARQADVDALTLAARLNDHGAGHEPAAAAVERLGLTPASDPTVATELGRKSFHSVRKAAQFDLALEASGCVDEATASVLLPRGRVARLEQEIVKGRIRLADAVEAAVRYASSKDMRNHVAAATRILVEVLGADKPLDLITADDLVAVLLFARRLPRDHGRKHGINRHTRDKAAARDRLRSKADEIAEADAADAAVREAAEDLDLPEHERLAYIERNLTVRVNHATIKKTHAHMMHPFKAAKAHLGWRGAIPQPVMKEYEDRVRAIEALERDADMEIVSRRRVRRSWSDERVATLLTSPVYSGCAGPKRRYRQGDTVIRDSVYWLPLIMLFAGLRPSEILQLHKTDVVMRDGVPAFNINGRCFKRLKNEASERLVPIHRTLLALGFLDWVNEQRDWPGTFLFPEIMHAISRDDSPARRFGERFDPVRVNLDIADEHEDVYALRRTAATQLANAGVGDADRAALLGHAQKDMTNLHYTDRALKRLQAEIDKIDYRVDVAFKPASGFPAIIGCSIVQRETVAVDLRVDRHGMPCRLTVFGDSTVETSDYAADIAPLPSWPAFASGEIAAKAVPARDVAAAMRRHIGDRRVSLLDKRSRDG